MSETSEHAARLLRAYQAQEKRFVERRFPLQFGRRSRRSASCTARPRPSTGIRRPTSRGIVSIPPATPRPRSRRPGRTWSRRAWSVYPGLTESTALLIRFCLESGSLGMDAKLFLSFRPAEEAKHLEVCHMLAERLGGYRPIRARPAWPAPATIRSARPRSIATCRSRLTSPRWVRWTISSTSTSTWATCARPRRGGAHRAPADRRRSRAARDLRVGVPRQPGAHTGRPRPRRGDRHRA